MRIFSLYLFMLIVSVTLNGCFFFTSPIQKWEITPEGATAFGLSRDGRFALSYSQQNQLQLWDLSENKRLALLGPLDQQNSTVTKIKISDNDRYAVTAGQNNFAVWDLAWTQSKGLWSISDGLIRDIDLSKDGEQVLMGLSNGKAIYVDLVSGRRMEFLAHNEKVNSVALSPNGRFALTGGNDYQAYLWDTKSGQILRKFEHEQRVVRVALQRDGDFAFTSDGGNEARVWDLHTGEEVSHLHSFARQLIFSAVRFSDDGSQLITGTPSGYVAVWDTQSGEQLDKFSTEPPKVDPPPRSVVYDVAFNQQHHVISANSAGIAEAWELDE
ncbi:WD domain, G-beta repeat [Vibrio ruber DSM 16370]|uniref:WD domain, G-beta repeat n=1 Tax=Vibrio ruber (strain DSM 16370 / JCM 11486 / BCRC 17186 / CECT 7878 / LMG 23124 / VR1) TaxID=1123498 RepID=A0A1R4LP90_VIBR1|nr:PQQ-binding-like beta-propeller repeat protein [Vibrio ruber]SJN58400.1 WD domain, G-beta repeat [Vibrio ruber DSM 16370]